MIFYPVQLVQLLINRDHRDNVLFMAVLKGSSSCETNTRAACINHSNLEYLMLFFFLLSKSKHCLGSKLQSCIFASLTTLFCQYARTEPSTTWKLRLNMNGDKLRNVDTVWIEI